MGLVELAILVIVIVAIAAIVYWFVGASGIAIPQPLKIALLAILAILAILIVANLAGMGPRVVNLR